MGSFYFDPATDEKLPITGPSEIEAPDGFHSDVAFLPLPEVDEDGNLIVPENIDPASGGLAQVIAFRPRG